METGRHATTAIEDDLVRRFLENHAAANAVIARACGGRTAGTDDVALADASSVVPYLNQAVLRRPVLDAADPVLDEIDAFFTGRTRPAGPATVLSWWPTPDCSARGWHRIGHPAFVVRAPAAVPAFARPGVEVQEVRDAAALAQAERVAIDGYPVPGAEGLPAGAVLPPALLDGPVRYRLGLLDGEPVGVAGSHVSHGVVNLCLAATLPAARRHGVWASLVWTRVADAPDLPAVAFTSDDSRPGFVRLGFVVVRRLTLWLRPPG